MRVRLTCALILAFSLMAPALCGGQAKDEVRKLEGTWRIVRGEDQGKPIPPNKLHADLVTIGRKDIIVKDKLNKQVYVMTYKLDPSQKPHAIDLQIVEGTKKGKSAKGIYALGGDTLKLAYAFAGTRPTRFSTKAGDKHLSFVLKRITR